MSERNYLKGATSKLLREYCKFQLEIQSVQEKTVYQRLLHIKPFLEEHKKIASPSRIKMLKPKFVHKYIIKQAPSFCRKYQKEFICALRSFFKFLEFYDYTKYKLKDSVPKLPTWQLSEVPRGIPWEDVEKLLLMPKRHTANGRRNYAILLLIASYGLRHYQARTLLLKNIKWKSGIIYFESCKGGRPLNLPLFENVAEALLDYIKNGRPKYDYPEVFLQTKNGDIKPLGHSLNSTLKIYYKRAGIKSSVTGFHAIRHSFASKLINQETPIKNISDLLGHTSIKSTLCYTKVAEKQLRAFSKEWPEVKL
jgi:integrase/recombinase XerD